MKKLNNNLDISPYVRQKIFLVMKFIPVFFAYDVYVCICFDIGAEDGYKDE